MANRFPVTVNSSVRRLEELPSGDNIDLSSSGVYDGTSTGTQGQILYSTETGVQWNNVPAEYDTLYNISAVDGDPGKKIIRLTASGSGSGNDDVTLVAGSNVTLSRSGDEITINSNYVDTNTVTRLKESVSGSYVSGDINLIANGSIFINQNGSNITIGATDTNTVTRLRATTSNPYIFNDITLLGSGAAQVSQSGNNITVSATNTVTQLRGTESSSYLTGDITLVAGGATQISQQSSNITISSTNTTYGVSVVDTSETKKSINLSGSDSSSVNIGLLEGTGISLSTNTIANEITFNVDIELGEIANVSASTPSEGDVLRYNSITQIWNSESLSFNDLSDIPQFAAVSTSGSYSDLTNTPALATVATSGSYSDLLDLPTLVTDAADLSDTTNRFFSGDYTDLSNTPALATVATSGSYSDLTDAPALATVATSGSYSDLNDKPSIPSEQNYTIETESATGGVNINLSESVAQTSSSVKIVPGASNKITVTRNASQEIEIDSTLNGIPSGVSITPSSITFEGSSINEVKTTLFIANPSTNRTITFPNDTGTVVLDGQNKTYRIDATDTSTNTYETKLGLIGSNTASTDYLYAVGSNGLKISSDRVGGSQPSASINTLTISAPPSVHVSATSPQWAKDGDLWFNPLTYELYVYDESQLPLAASTYTHFQAVESGGNRFYNNGNTANASLLPSTNQYIVGSGIPINTKVSLVVNPSGSSVGYFNIDQNVSTNIPHGAKLHFYNYETFIDVSELWVRISVSSPNNFVPSSPTSPGIPGQIVYSSDYLYVCIGVDTWKRTALSSW